MDIEVLFFRRYPRVEALHQAVLHALMEGSDLLAKLMGLDGAVAIEAASRPGFRARAGGRTVHVELRTQERLRIDHVFDRLRGAEPTDCALFVLLGVTPHLCEALSSTRLSALRRPLAGSCELRLGEGWDAERLEAMRQISESPLPRSAVRFLDQEALRELVLDAEAYDAAHRTLAEGYASVLGRTLRYREMEYELTEFAE